MVVKTRGKGNDETLWDKKKKKAETLWDKANVYMCASV